MVGRRVVVAQQNLDGQEPELPSRDVGELGERRAQHERGRFPLRRPPRGHGGPERLAEVDDRGCVHVVARIEVIARGHASA